MTRSQRIPMSKLNALTFHAGRKTTARRTSPVPQLTCEGKACRIYEPDVVQCTAVGDDGAGGLEWSCTAELPKGIRFGAVEVGCEGWDSSDDPYILKGSCGLTYNLVRTSSALEDGGPSSYLPRFSSSTKAPHPLVSLAVLSLTLYALYTFLIGYLYPRRRSITNFFRSGPSGGGWGGGGGGGGGPGFGGAPPPPYSSKPPEQSQGWRPGFWTGALAGALGTQAAQGLRNRGGYANAQEERFRQRQAGWGMGMGGGGGLRDDGWGRPTRSGGDGASGSGEMRQSTGFGGTRNR